MKEYDVKIKETLERTVTVKASTREEAQEIVETGWKNSEYVLDSEDFVGADFAIEAERSLNLEKMNVLLVEPWKYPKVIELENEYESLKDAVGGMIEVTYPFDEDEVGIILNEEGKLIGLEPNRAMRTKDGDVYDIYVGPFLVVGLTEDDFCSLSAEQMEKYEKIFHQPEMFMKLGQRIMVIPLDDGQVKEKNAQKEITPKTKHSPEHGEL